MTIVRSRWLVSYDFACHSKACAPPPVGAGGSTKVRTHALKSLASPDSGFTLSTKLNPLRSGYAVALDGSDRLVVGSSAFRGGKPSKKLVGIVRDRIDAAFKTEPPKGVKVAIGGWHNHEDGKIEINVTFVFPRQRENQAIAFAKQQNQIAIFALHKGEVIMTGGTGGTREAE